MTPNDAAPKKKTKPGALALMQRGIVCVFLLWIAAWLWFFWTLSPLLAWSGALFWLFGYTLLLGLELVLMHWINRRDPTPRARVSELLLAWLAECWTAAVVFGWRQPFSPNDAPDHLSGSQLKGQRGVVFIHGLVCNRGFWTPWLQRLQGTRHAYVAVNLEPVFGSISSYVPVIEAAIQAVTLSTGRRPLLVCHSMGGLAAKAWLATRLNAGNDVPVHRIVSIGSPHRGTWLARFGFSTNAVEMREGSNWLAELNRITSAEASLWLCWYSNSDHIVFPASTATMHGADNRLVRGAAHVQLAFVPEVVEGTLALLNDHDKPSPPNITS